MRYGRVSICIYTYNDVVISRRFSTDLWFSCQWDRTVLRRSRTWVVSARISGRRAPCQVCLRLRSGSTSHAGRLRCRWRSLRPTSVSFRPWRFPDEPERRTRIGRLKISGKEKENMINKIAWKPDMVVDEQKVINENAVLHCDNEKNIVYFIEHLRKPVSF